MKVLIFNDSSEAVARVSRALADQVAAKPNSVLGLATGGTMEPVYVALIAAARTRGLSFSGISSFNLDEYVGVPPAHPQSYGRYMRERLFDHIDADPSRLNVPRGDAPSPTLEAARYDEAIRDAGGIDLQLLGIGSNGHIGFNEPGSSLSSRTRVKTLTTKTREDNARFFAPGEPVPRYAITMGIGTILESRQIILLATGAEKAAAVAGMVEGPVSASCPATVLQFHRAVTVVLDQAAAARLTLRDYYETVHPGGAEADVP